MKLLTKTAGETVIKILFVFDKVVSNCQIVLTRFMTSEPRETK
jgi:hypothetical protein